MKFGIYSIRDVYTGFLAPTIESTDIVAQRNFEFAVNKPETLLYTRPGDYELYKIGEFESDSGVVTPLTPIQVVSSAVSLRKVDRDA